MHVENRFKRRIGDGSSGGILGGGTGSAADGGGGGGGASAGYLVVRGNLTLNGQSSPAVATFP